MTLRDAHHSSERDGFNVSADVIQEPTAQPYGVRDCAFRDPAGNHIRINEVR